MKSKEFFDEFFFWLMVAVGISLFLIPFRVFSKVVVAQWAPTGLKEALAS